MVHTFTALGQYLAADVNSGAVHVLDKLSYDLLSRVEGPMGEKLPEELAGQLTQYDPAELAEAWEELRGLQDQGLLFTDDEYVDRDKAMELPRQAVVKALCLHVSHDCNLRCKYCFASTGDFGTGHRMTMDFETAKRAIDFMKEEGVADEMIVGPEYEFYIFDDVAYSTDPQSSGFEIEACQAEWSNNNNGYQVRHKAGYHTSLPLDVNQDLRNRICLMMEEWGVKVKYHHTEVGGCGQLEVEVELGEMTQMADNTMVAKYIIKNAAAQEGRTATFMPKPVAGEAGSGMHVHMQLFKNGEPVFYDEKGYGQLSQTALWFIGGMLQHAGSLCAITNPSTNSYKRLVPGFEAPVTIGYAMANRSAVVRIPAYAKAPKNKRFELRNPDATCNPYYAFAAILMAGLDGIRNQIDPHEKGWGPYDFNLFELSDEEKAKIDSLPKSLGEALDALEKDHAYLTRGGVFPERLIQIWIQKKRGELEAIERIPTPAEFSMYYDL